MCIGNFISPKKAATPAPPPAPPPPPTIKPANDNQAANRATSRVRREALARKGRNSLVATSPFGTQSQASLNRPTLLGQAA